MGDGTDVIRRLTVVNIVLVLFVVAVVVGGFYLVATADPNAGHAYCHQLDRALAGRGCRAGR